MKKKSKVLLVLLLTGFILAFSGAILATTGFATGGVLNIKTINIGGFNSIGWGDNDYNEGKQIYTTTQANTKFTADVNAAVASINIVSGDQFKVETHNIKQKNISFKEMNGSITLEITTDNKFFSFPQDKGKVINITLPKEIQDINVTADIGDINMENLQLEKLVSTNDVGAINIENVIADNIKIESNVGEIDAIIDFNNSCTINNDIGNATITLMGKEENYDYDLSCDIGDLTFGGSDDFGFESSYVQSNNMNKLLKSKVNVGELSIEFQNR